MIIKTIDCDNTSCLNTARMESTDGADNEYRWPDGWLAVYLVKVATSVGRHKHFCSYDCLSVWARGRES